MTLHQCALCGRYADDGTFIPKYDEKGRLAGFCAFLCLDCTDPYMDDPEKDLSALMDDIRRNLPPV